MTGIGTYNEWLEKYAKKTGIPKEIADTHFIARIVKAEYKEKEKEKIK